MCAYQTRIGTLEHHVSRYQIFEMPSGSSIPRLHQAWATRRREWHEIAHRQSATCSGKEQPAPCTPGAPQGAGPGNRDAREVSRGGDPRGRHFPSSNSSFQVMRYLAHLHTTRRSLFSSGSLPYHWPMSTRWLDTPIGFSQLAVCCSALRQVPGQQVTRCVTAFKSADTRTRS